MPRLDAIPALCCLVALLLAVTLLALAASGHFPQRSKRAGAPGSLVVWTSMVVGMAALACGLAAAWTLLPAPAAVIAGGLAVLAGPLVLQQCPDRFVDGPAALAVFAGSALLFAVNLLSLAGQAA